MKVQRKKLIFNKVKFKNEWIIESYYYDANYILYFPQQMKA